MNLLWLATRGVYDQPAIVRAVNKAPGTGDERQVREAVRRGLRSPAGDRPAPVDLRQNRRVGGLLDGVGCGLGDYETNVEIAARVVDDDQIAWTQIPEASKDCRSSEHIIHVSGERRRAHLARDPTASIPERLLPHRIGGQALRRVHHVLHCDPNSKYGSIDMKRRNSELERYVHRPGAQIEAWVGERPRDHGLNRQLD